MWTIPNIPCALSFLCAVHVVALAVIRHQAKCTIMMHSLGYAAIGAYGHTAPQRASDATWQCKAEEWEVDFTCPTTRRPTHWLNSEVLPSGLCVATA